MRPPPRLALLALALLCAAPGIAGEAPSVRTDRGDARVLPLPPQEGAFTFALLGDRTGGPPEGLAILARAVEDANRLGPDLVMTVGDMVPGYNRTAEWLEDMRAFRAVMDRLTMPWFPVAGNHDVTWGGGQAPPGHHERDYETHFGPLWYWFPHKNAAFVVLYSDEGDRAGNRKGWDDSGVNRFSDAQLDWLESTLAAARAYDHVFVFLHHPRWVGSYYPGSNWEEVHGRLVAAGNVTAVFAGHLHRQRYDGRRDGIEYFTLSTTGGGLPFDVPGTGFSHHLDLVTVRTQGIHVATIPVGGVLDPRALSAERRADVDRLRELVPDAGESVLAFDAQGFGEGTYRVRVANPTARPIEATLAVAAEDRAWRFAPATVHLRLAPGLDETVSFAWSRRPDGGLEELTFPALVLGIVYPAPDVRIVLPERRIELAWRLDGAPPEAPTNGVVDLAGDGTCLCVDARRLVVPDGPFTVEGWLEATDLAGRRGFLSRAERSEHGLFVTDGRPSFHVFLGDAYVTAQAPGPLLEPGRWHHVAGVFDGAHVALYVDGRLVARRAGAGSRRVNELPLCVGADPDGEGRPTSPFAGRIDEVRVSRGARYTTSEFPLALRHEPDADTLLLLHLDRSLGPLAADHGPGGAHALVVGRPTWSAR